MLNSWLVDSFNKFRNTLKQGRTPHSVIISGDPSLGSAYLAVEIAKLLLCQQPQQGDYCNQCKSCHMFNLQENPSHPDFIALLSSSSKDETAALSHNFEDLYADMGLLDEGEDLQRQSVKIDGVRSLCDFATQGSVFGFGKVCVISNAHLMGEGASNALLKTFEEPPKDTTIILLSKNTDSLPATILSRAFKIELPYVKTEVALDYLKRDFGSEFNESRAKICLELASNSPISAIKLYKIGLDEAAIKLIKSLNLAIEKQINKQAVLDCLLEMDNSQKVLILQSLIKDLLKYKALVPKEQLPLLEHVDLQYLSKLKAASLFKVFNSLSYINGDDLMLPSRAPNALLSMWIDALTK